MTQYIFGKEVIENKPYMLIGVFHDGVYNCASYTSSGDDEKITSIQTGEVFTNLRKFVESVRKCETYHEWSECHFYDEDKADWYPMLYLRHRRSFY